MIKFVDLNTGNTFDGREPYIFWLDNEQSINIIYSKSICFISNVQEVQISIEKNEIFHLIDPSALLNSEIETIYGFEYKNINNLIDPSSQEYINTYNSIGVPHHNYFIHIIYILAQAKQPGEYRVNFNIDGDEYLLGADFYNENESLYINLSNNGFEIPEIIQKSIYETNIHEENRDNILINRKWKELLSNFWDIVANKGSYKSLYNSLKWFEYGDKVKLCELWKNSITDKLFEKEIQEMFEDSYFNSLNNFTKTTYLSLHYALEEYEKENNQIIWDEEGNPNLKYISSKWSTQDLALKLSLLGSFYESYFMPIHMDLIHSTIEDIVYTNTFKLINGSTINRDDFIYSFEDIKCNVKTGDVYKLGDVQYQVGPETLFGLQYGEYNTIGSAVGVQTTPVHAVNEHDKELATFVSQLYNGIGVVVDFNIQIPLNDDDKIKREILIFKRADKTHHTIIEHKILCKDIFFQLFCPTEGEYEVRLQFDSVSGKVFTKRIIFNVIDSNSISLKIYKIQNIQSLVGQELGQQCQLNDYIFSLRQITTDNSNPIQYIPAKSIDLLKDKFKWTGICLNHLIITQGDVLNHLTNYAGSIIADTFERYYFVKYKIVPTILDDGSDGEKIYSICVSRSYGFVPNNNQGISSIYYKYLKNTDDPDRCIIYREDYIFVPEFHKLVELGPADDKRLPTINDYTITDEDAICVIPSLPHGKYIDKYDWEFINVSKPNKESTKLNYIKEPFITDNNKSPLDPGYYNIKFNYRLTNENKINSVVLDSAFRKI